MPSSELDPRAVTAPQFAEVLAHINRGELAGDCTVGLADVVQAVQQTGKKGTLTLVITVEPFKGSKGALNVGAKVATKLPTEQVGHASVMFTDAVGGLHQTDPTSPQLPFAEEQRAERPLAS